LESPRESLFDRAYRFLRAVIVGSGATAIDFVVLTSCIRVAGIAPTSARLPALIAGATFQFFGNRTFAFRAQAGSMSRQAKLFVTGELIALVFNLSIYRWLVPRVVFLPPEVTSLLGTFIVFVTFGYPMRKLIIFRVPEPTLPVPDLAPEPVVERIADTASAREQARLEAEKLGKSR
jgi:putative flippase GtrA